MRCTFKGVLNRQVTGRQCVGPHNAITLMRCESGVCEPLSNELVSLFVLFCFIRLFVIIYLLSGCSTMKVCYIIRSALLVGCWSREFGLELFGMCPPNV